MNVVKLAVIDVELICFFGNNQWAILRLAYIQAHIVFLVE